MGSNLLQVQVRTFCPDTIVQECTQVGLPYSLMQSYTCSACHVTHNINAGMRTLHAHKALDCKISVYSTAVTHHGKLCLLLSAQRT